MTLVEFEERLKNDSNAFAHMTMHERELNIDVCRAAIKYDLQNIQLLSRRFWRKNLELLQEVITSNALSLEYIDERIQKRFPQIVVDALITSGGITAVKRKEIVQEEFYEYMNKPYYRTSFENVYALRFLDKSILHNYSYLVQMYEMAEDKKEFLFDAVDSTARNMIINRNVSEITGTKWQSESQKQMADEKNVILSSPTGSGKTRVFLEWALKKKERPIFITSPIIALSNQRYRELVANGYKVGLETGDKKIIPQDCDFICCTQEIYTNRYMQEKDATLIMDEFHYIFENPERARAYIDALYGSKAKNLLICSATMGNMRSLKSYLEKVSDRKFSLVNNRQRLTELSYEGKIEDNEIENALVVGFSNRNIDMIIDRIIETRQNLDKWKDENPNEDNKRYNDIVSFARKCRNNSGINGCNCCFLWNRKICWYYASKAEGLYRNLF